MPKTNIEYLRELLTTDEQREWLDSIENDISHMKSTIGDLKEEVSDAEYYANELRSEIRGLENRVSKLESMADEIDTGIGKIKFSIEGSLDQQLLMEAMADLIKEQGVKGVLDHLRAEFGV